MSDNKTICGVDCEPCPMKASCGGCRASGGRPFGGDCILAVCNGSGKRPDGCGGCGSALAGGCGLKTRIIAEFNDLHIPGMPTVTDLYALCGSFINLEYTLPGGQKIKLWDDTRIYLGTQLEVPGSERCFGLTADEEHLLVCTYGEGGIAPEIVVYKKR